MIRAVTVYCSSSSAIARENFIAAEDLGRQIAGQGWMLVYGGNRTGLMGHLADAVRAAAGKVVGITPQLFVDKGIADDLCDELVVCDSMRDRKRMMEERADAFVALPGGLGTFEELFEIIVGKQLGYHRKPIVLLNTNHYFDPLLTMIDHGITQKFIKPAAKQLFFNTDSPTAAVEYIRDYVPVPMEEKWFSHTNPPSGTE